MRCAPPMALSIMFPPLLFGVLRDRFGSVLPPLALHIVYNAGYFMSWPDQAGESKGSGVFLILHQRNIVALYLT